MDNRGKANIEAFVSSFFRRYFLATFLICLIHFVNAPLSGAESQSQSTSLPDSLASRQTATLEEPQDQHEQSPPPGANDQKPGAAEPPPAGKDQTPPCGEQQQPAPERKEEQKPDTIVDVVHAEISHGIQGPATWLDSFFGNQRFASELNKSYVRFRYNVLLEEHSPMVRKPDLEVRIVLPQLKEKTHLVFSGRPNEGPDFSALQSNTQSDQVTTGEERNVSAAVHQTFLDTAQQNFILKAGMRLHKTRPVVTLGPRYRVLFKLDKWNLRLIEDVVWTSNGGWNSKSTVDLERPLPHGLFFRTSNEWIWTEHVKGYVYGLSFSVGQPLNPWKAIDYEWINVFHTRPVNELAEVDLRVRYRQRLWRDWFFFEVAPQYRFPRDHAFKATPGILFRIDMIFGSYDRLK